VSERCVSLSDACACLSDICVLSGVCVSLSDVCMYLSSDDYAFLSAQAGAFQFYLTDRTITAAQALASGLIQAMRTGDTAPGTTNRDPALDRPS